MKSPLSKKKNCEVLAGMFEITNPANYEIELLKHGQVLDMGISPAPTGCAPSKRGCRCLKEEYSLNLC